eukprot:SAG31_NODE_2525_length_5562_cov_2.144243_4_plen_200_part_00
MSVAVHFSEYAAYNQIERHARQSFHPPPHSPAVLPIGRQPKPPSWCLPLVWARNLHGRALHARSFHGHLRCSRLLRRIGTIGADRRTATTVSATAPGCIGSITIPTGCSLAPSPPKRRELAGCTSTKVAVIGCPCARTNALSAADDQIILLSCVQRWAQENSIIRRRKGAVGAAPTCCTSIPIGDGRLMFTSRPNRFSS